MNFGDKLRKERRKKGMSQKELGYKLGVSQAMIAQYEKGDRNPKKETIEKIAKALDVNVVSLVGYEDYCDMIVERKENAFIEYLSSIGYEIEYSDYNYIICHNNEKYIIRQEEYYKLCDNIKKFSKFAIEQLLEFAEKQD